MEYQVPKEESGLRLLDVLKKILVGSWSSRRIKKIIDIRGCFINGESVLVSTRKVAQNDLIYIKDAAIARASQGKKKVSILFEDEYFLAVDKPIDLCSDHISFTRALPQYPEIHLVHRLDRETSGVMILAKTEDAKEKAEDLFRHREVKKSYDAIVHGHMDGESGTFESDRYGRLKTLHGQSYWTAKAESGVFASTDWFLKRVKGEQSYLTLCPLTGRTHQLRVQLSEANHPIVGDPLYGEFETSSQRMFLHAKSIEFKHPFNGKELKISSQLPDFFLNF